MIPPPTLPLQIEEDEDEPDEQGHTAREMETDSDKANFFLQKLQDVTELFEAKTEDYSAMEEKLEKLRKVWTMD